MRKNFWICSITWLLLVLNLSSARASTIDFERLFFGQQSVTYLSSHRLVASYQSERSSLYVILNIELDQIFALNVGDAMPLGDEQVVLQSIDSDRLVFDMQLAIHSLLITNSLLARSVL